jgi:hypothetical protein
MPQRRADGARWTDDPGADRRHPGPVRARLSAVGRFFARRFRCGPQPGGPVGHAGSSPRPSATRTAPRHLTAPPVPPSSASQLLDTRFARELRHLLAALGTTSGSVAAGLEAAGVRAAPEDPARSPLALFLTAVVGADPNVQGLRVRPDAVVVELRAWWRPPVTVFLPPVVHEFSAAFDAGCYPALLRDGRRPGGADRARGADAERGE